MFFFKTFKTKPKLIFRISNLLLDPDCIARGGAGDYPIIVNSQCGNSFYRCDANLQRVTVSCGTSTNGFHFGISASINQWTCLQQTAPTSCGVSKYYRFLLDMHLNLEMQIKQDLTSLVLPF